MESTSRNPAATRPIRYELDNADRLIAIDDGWRAFARDNGAGGLDGDAVLGQEIWHFIGDSATQIIYRLMFDAVRTRLRPITVFLRCDGPRVRRLYALTCAPSPRLGLQMTSRSVREEPRPYVSLLDNQVSRSDERVTVCSWCKKIRSGDGDWTEIEHVADRFDAARPPQLDHQVCPDCQLETLKDIRHSIHALDERVPPALPVTPSDGSSPAR